MTNSDDEATTSHAPGSQPSTRPGSDVPQTITAPTPPVAWTSDPPEPDDLADGDDRAKRSRDDDRPEAKPQDD